MYIQKHSSSLKKLIILFYFFNFVVENDEFLRLMDSSVFHNYFIYTRCHSSKSRGKITRSVRVLWGKHR
jgi:hypothetical protein